MKTLSFTETSRILKTADNAGCAKLPENCVYIGNDFIVVLSLNDGKVDVRICQFVRNPDGELLPSENEIVLSPFLWVSLCKSVNNLLFIDLPTTFESFSLVENELFLAAIEKLFVTLQRCGVKQDFSRYFVPGILRMTEYQ